MKFITVLFTALLAMSQLQAQEMTKGWDLLNGKDLFGAIKHFEKAAKDKTTAEEANLILALLYPRVDRKDDGIEAFLRYYEVAANPVATTYALYYYESVLGEIGARDKDNHKVLKMLAEDSRNKGSLATSLHYQHALNSIFEFDEKGYAQHIENMGVIEDWSLVGPFDNVMNSGFDKDHGVLSDPKPTAAFESAYGGNIEWFTPQIDTKDGYVSVMSYFSGGSPLVYAQTFVTVEQDMDIILSLGYSGSLKLWLNDEQIYSEREIRKTAADDYQFATSLKAGTNRILVQIGGFETSNPNFAVKLTDRNHDPIAYTESSKYTDYYKGAAASTSSLPHFAITSLESKYKENPKDLLNLLLLAKAHKRRNDLNNAEKYLKKAEEIAPLNYLVIRNLNILYNQKDNNTEVSKYYEILEKTYPEDMDILSENISEFIDQDKNEEARSAIKRYKELYRNENSHYALDVAEAGIDEDYLKVIDLMDKMYDKNPTNPDIVYAKYTVAKAMGGGSESVKILERFLKKNYSHTIVNALANSYMEDGNIKKAINLYKSTLPVVNGDRTVLNQISSAYTKQEKFDDAIEILQQLAISRPSDANNYDELATLYNIKKDKKTALANYEKSLEYYPFDFMLNEKRRELLGKKTLLSYTADVDPDDIIKKYEATDKTADTKPADIVYHSKTRLLNEWGAYAMKESYIIKINKESALEEYQTTSFGGSGQTKTTVIDVMTIKANGNRISAEDHGSERVYVNLEEGDYIYVSYVESQRRGGKTSKFQYDSYGFDAYMPSFNREFVVITEKEDEYVFEMPNGAFEPTKTTKDNLHIYTWSQEQPTLIKDENYTVPYSDFATNVQMTSKHDWSDIIDWYRDLSNEQARQDYTIKSLVKELKVTEAKDDLEKAKLIYDFIVKDIQYSSIDFRQSSYVPQLASDVYHSRLGDCKDVSTLFAAMGREVGLDVDLVLINTSNNGSNDIVKPSMNFNHCIAKLNLPSQSLYLELTDPFLPFGHLYPSHHMASILDIPFDGNTENVKLAKLTHNKGYANDSRRTTVITIKSDDEVKVATDVEQTGTLASNIASAYLDDDQDTRKETLEGWLGRLYKGTIKIENFDFTHMVKGSDKVNYKIDYLLNSELMKIGSFQSLKIPFHETIAYASDFQAETRTTPMDYKFYENADLYDEQVSVNIEGGRQWLEVPENVELSYKGNSYSLKFTKKSDSSIEIDRKYIATKDVVMPEEYEAFRAFILAVIEAEQTHLIIK